MNLADLYMLNETLKNIPNDKTTNTNNDSNKAEESFFKGLANSYANNPSTTPMGNAINILGNLAPYLNSNKQNIADAVNTDNKLNDLVKAYGNRANDVGNLLDDSQSVQDGFNLNRYNDLQKDTSYEDLLRRLYNQQQQQQQLSDLQPQADVMTQQEYQLSDLQPQADVMTQQEYQRLMPQQPQTQAQAEQMNANANLANAMQNKSLADMKVEEERQKTIARNKLLELRKENPDVEVPATVRDVDLAKANQYIADLNNGRVSSLSPTSKAIENKMAEQENKRDAEKQAEADNKFFEEQIKNGNLVFNPETMSFSAVEPASEYVQDLSFDKDGNLVKGRDWKDVLADRMTNYIEPNMQVEPTTDEVAQIANAIPNTAQGQAQQQTADQLPVMQQLQGQTQSSIPTLDSITTDYRNSMADMMGTGMSYADASQIAKLRIANDTAKLRGAIIAQGMESASNGDYSGYYNAGLMLAHLAKVDPLAGDLANIVFAGSVTPKDAYKYNEDMTKLQQKGILDMFINDANNAAKLKAVEQQIKGNKEIEGIKHKNKMVEIDENGRVHIVENNNDWNNRNQHDSIFGTGRASGGGSSGGSSGSSSGGSGGDSNIVNGKKLTVSEKNTRNKANGLWTKYNMLAQKRQQLINSHGDQHTINDLANQMEEEKAKVFTFAKSNSRLFTRDELVGIMANPSLNVINKALTSGSGDSGKIEAALKDIGNYDSNLANTLRKNLVLHGYDSYNGSFVPANWTK